MKINNKLNEIKRNNKWNLIKHTSEKTNSNVDYYIFTLNP